jgi:hypothetical protein
MDIGNFKDASDPFARTDDEKNFFSSYKIFMGYLEVQDIP